VEVVVAFCVGAVDPHPASVPAVINAKAAQLMVAGTRLGRHRLIAMAGMMRADLGKDGQLNGMSSEFTATAHFASYRHLAVMIDAR
jgi:hypothetical protein